MTEIVEWLLTEHGQNAIDVASRARSVSPDPLAVAKCLQRELDLPSAYRTAATLQAELRDKLIARWGEAPRWLLTRDGIEQATHPVVRRWRAARLAGLGVQRIADVGCGLGFEAASFAEAGLTGYAIERDREVASVAAVNLRDTGFDVLNFDVVEDDEAMTAVLAEVDAVFVDPARRDPNAPRRSDGSSGQRVSDPAAWSPSWDWVLAAAQRQPRLVAKVAPGIDKTLLPASAQTTWFSVAGTLVEASVWCAGLGLEPGARAIAVDRHGDFAELSDTDAATAAIGAVEAYLLDPSPAVTRAGLVQQLAARTGSHRLDPHLAYLSCEAEPADSPLFHTYEVVESLPFKEAEAAAALQRAGARDVQVSARGWGGDIDALTHSLKKGLAGDKVISLLIARIGEGHTAILAQRVN